MKKMGCYRNELMDAVDTYIELPPRDVDKAFLDAC